MFKICLECSQLSEHCINLYLSFTRHVMLYCSRRGRKNLKKGALQNYLHLSLKLKLANPWIGEFMVDMPMEVMDCIAEFVLNRNSFGHKFSETNN